MTWKTPSKAEVASILICSQYETASSRAMRRTLLMTGSRPAHQLDVGVLEGGFARADPTHLGVAQRGEHARGDRGTGFALDPQHLGPAALLQGDGAYAGQRPHHVDVTVGQAERLPLDHVPVPDPLLEGFRGALGDDAAVG